MNSTSCRITRRHPRRRPKTLAKVLVAVIPLVGLLSGCGGSASSGPVTLKLTESATYQPAFEAIVKLFNQTHKGVQVEATYAASADLGTLLPTELQSGNAPDVFFAPPGRGNGPLSALSLAASGYLADLSDLPATKQIPKTMLPYVTYKNKVVSWPTDVSGLPVGYNKDLFAKNDITPPTTFGQLLTVCTELASRGITPIAWPGANPVNDTFPALLLANNDVLASAPNWDQLRQQGSTTFASSPAWRRTLTDFQRLIAAKCFGGSAAVGATQPQAQQEFATGKAAMFPSLTNGFAGVLAINPKLNLASFAWPGQTSGRTVYPFTVVGVGVYAKSKHLKEAKAFVSWLAEPGPSRLLAKISQGATPVDFASGKLPATPIWASAKPSISRGQEAPVININFPNSSVLNVLGSMLPGLVTGQSSPGQILTAMDKAWATPQ